MKKTMTIKSTLMDNQKHHYLKVYFNIFKATVVLLHVGQCEVRESASVHLLNSTLTTLMALSPMKLNSTETLLTE